jgi:hypothetical protein
MDFRAVVDRPVPDPHGARLFSFACGLPQWFQGLGNGPQPLAGFTKPGLRVPLLCITLRDLIHP